MSNHSSHRTENHEFMFIMALIIFMAIIYFLRTHFEYVATVWKFTREIQTYLFTILPSEIVNAFPALNDVSYAHEFISKTSPYTLAPETVLLIDSFISTYIHILTGLALIAVGFYKKTKNSEQSRSYEMENLLKRQSTLYPELVQYNNYHPEKHDVRYVRGDKKSMAHAASIDPSEFALMVPPLGLEEDAKKDENLMTSIWDGEEILNENLALKAFEKQLGRRYYGTESLQDYELKLYNLLIKKLVFDFEDISKTVNEYVEVIISNKRPPRDLLPNEEVLFNKIKERCKKSQKKNIMGKPAMEDIEILSPAYSSAITSDKSLNEIMVNITAERVMAKHAFIRTGLSSLLAEARKSGVLPAENFRWIKGIDRTLWYTLSNLGRNVSFVECAGVHAHWLVEKEAKTAIPMPEVSEVIKGLKIALQMDTNKSMDEIKI